MATWVLGTSIVLQFAAAWAALRLARATDRSAGWLLISLAVTLMGLRRCITLSRVLVGDALQPDLAAEFVALGISALMLVGIRTVAPRIRTLVAAREEALESERRYRTMVENSVEAIVILDIDEGRFVDVNTNAEQLFGLDREALLKTGPVQLSPEHQPGGEVSSELATGYLAHARAGEKVSFEWTHQCSSGREFPCEVRLVRLPSSAGCIVRGSITDISERKLAAEQMQRTQKLESLGVMAGGIAHDFNNLLVGILGNANLARLELAEDSPLRETVESIETGALRAADLAREMLAYSGRARFAVEPVDIGTLLGEMTHLVTAAISKSAELSVSFPPDLPAVEADPTQLRQVVMNLILNASDAVGDDSGRIEVTGGVEEREGGHTAWSPVEAPPPGRYVWIEVRDTGCGMDAETRERIFDPFFTTKFTGRGLGLAAVLGIVRAHHGGLEVESEPGRGTVFRLCFPCLAESVALGSTVEPPSEWRGVGTVLAVDDEPAVLELCVRALGRCGLTVLTAEDGGAGLEVFRRHKDEIEVVVLDVTMPVLGGAEVLREIQRIKPAANVILSSGYDESEAGDRFAEGPITFLQKPYTAESLIDQVRAALELAHPAQTRATRTGPVG
jgi:PAS domain S-box-containing protein